MSTKFAARLTACCALTLALSCLSAAQESPTPGSSGSSAQAQPQEPSQAKPAAAPAGEANKDKATPDAAGQGKVEGTSNDRLFYTLPNFLTLQGGQKLPPLSAKDKFKVVALGTFDYFEYPWWGVLSAIKQANNGDPALGQGWASYAKRYGITGADSMIENFMVGAVFPSVLHQDPRFYQSGKGGFFKRAGYSMSRIVITRGDSGATQFNFSEILGASTAAAISTYSYHPGSTYLRTPTNPHLFVASEHTFSNTVSTFYTQVGLDAVTIVVKEFWPDIHRKMSHKSKAVQSSASGNP